MMFSWLHCASHPGWHQSLNNLWKYCSMWVDTNIMKGVEEWWGVVMGPATSIFGVHGYPFTSAERLAAADWRQTTARHRKLALRETKVKGPPGYDAREARDDGDDKTLALPCSGSLPSLTCLCPPWTLRSSGRPPVVVVVGTDGGRGGRDAKRARSLTGVQHLHSYQTQISSEVFSSLTSFFALATKSITGKNTLLRILKKSYIKYNCYLNKWQTGMSQFFCGEKTLFHLEIII